MTPRGKPVRNQRRSGARQRRAQNLLEVTVRSRLATRQRNRRAMVIMCKLILVCGMVGGSIYGVKYCLKRYLWENPQYNLAAVEITDDSNGVTRDAILTAGSLQLGKNIFSIRLNEARDRIAALPQVEHAELQRVLPNKITVDITERHPIAWLADQNGDDPTSSDNAFLVDSKGVLFKPKRKLPEYLRLPTIYGVPTENFLSGETVDLPEVRSALDLVQRNTDNNCFQLESLDISKGYCMVATDAKKAKITFGLDNVSAQLDRLGRVLDYVNNSHKELQTVNLLVERNVPVTFAPPPGEEQAEPDEQENKPAKSAAKASSTPPRPERSEAEHSEKSERTTGREKNLHEKSSHEKSSREKTSHERTARAEKSGKSKAEPVRQSKKSTASTVSKKHSEPVIRRAEPVIRRAEPVDPSVLKTTQ